MGDSCDVLANCHATAAVGVCVDDGLCQCADGFDGVDCGRSADCTTLSQCFSHGSCIKDGACYCDAGYAGYDCSSYSCETKGCGELLGAVSVLVEPRLYGRSVRPGVDLPSRW